jgi:hypothetical protein
MAYSVASVPGATGYLWTLPAGASIATGTNTNSITVDFSLAAASGNMSVSTTNSCGSGTASPPLFIRVLPQVSTLENISVANGSTACYDAVQTIIVAGNGSSFSVLPGGSVTMIAGQSIACMPGTSVQPGGYLHGYITTNNEYCGAMVLPAMAVVSDVSEHNSSLVRSLFRIYPNPASDYLIIELAGEGQFPNTRVEVYGMDGVKVYSGGFAGEKSHTIPLTSLLPGVYVIHVVFGLDAGTVKMIKL